MLRRSGVARLGSSMLALVVAACAAPVASPSPSVPASNAPSALPGTILPTVPPTATPIPSATASPVPSIGPSPTASIDFFPPELAYVNQFVMRVAVSDLNVRSKPSKSGVSRGKAAKGALFMMYDWPVVADGYTWYPGFTLLTSTPGVLPALPQPIDTGYDEVLGGWMATGTEDTPFLIPVAPRCPAVPDLVNVAAMLASERISCFGSESLTLEGPFGCDFCDGETPGTFEPAWLAGYLQFDLLGDGDDVTLPLALHFPPGGPAAPLYGSTIRVVGHFADVRSSTCAITLEDGVDPVVPLAAAAAEQWCQGKFVVERYDVIG